MRCGGLVVLLMHPNTTDNQNRSQNPGEHAGILSRLDVAENTSDESTNAAEKSDRQENYPRQNQDIGNGCVGKMVHISFRENGDRSKRPERQALNRKGKPQMREV